MCDFCENIPKVNDEESWEKVKDRSDYIFQTNDDFHLFGETGDSGCNYALENIKFCPMCGRKLSEETEKTSTEELLATLKDRLADDEYLKLKESAEMFSDGINGLWEVFRKGNENGERN